MSIHTEFLDALTPSAIRAITARIRDKKRDGIRIVNFAGGMPDEATFPAEVFVQITADIPAALMRYSRSWSLS